MVTLLGKASLWAGPGGSFQVLSARLELCHPPRPAASMAPAPLAAERGSTTDLYPCPARHQGGREGGSADITSLTHTHTYTRILALTLWHTSIFTHPIHPPKLQPMVYFPAIRSTPIQHPRSLHPHPSFSTSRRLPGSRERLHTHIHPTMPLRVFPDVLVYIMERAGRREAADSQPPRTRLRVNPVLTSIHVVSTQKSASACITFGSEFFWVFFVFWSFLWY